MMQDDPQVLMEVKGLSKYFPVTAGLFRKEVGRIRAVEDVNFSIHKGEILGVVGESGSGKSTLARALIRLIEPSAGSIRFEGEEWRSLSSAELLKRRLQVQMIFQDPFSSLNPRKTVASAVGEPLRYHGLVRSPEEEIDSVVTILEKIGLSTDFLWRYPHQLSGGQQQRICIGRAIALRPKLLICDEAISSLDVSVQAQIINLLLELKETLDLSYLFISHDLSVVRYMSDKIVVLYLGKVMESASTAELFRNPKHPYTQALLAAIPKSHPNEKVSKIILKGDMPSPRNPPSGCPFRTRCPFAEARCADPPPRQRVVDPDTGKDDHYYDCILNSSG